MGIRTIVAHSTADRDSPVTAFADETVQIGPAPARRSYLNAAALVEAAVQRGADAVHPGYGFLSEDPDFAEACESHGLTFIGPRPSVLARLGEKAQARKLAAECDVRLLPGSTATLETAAEAKAVADDIGYPVIVKAVAGGGGRGMAVIREPRDFLRAYGDTRANAQLLFGDSRVYVEKYLQQARHVEVQVLADGFGDVIHLGGRDCTVQRRRQKLVEESPPPDLPPGLLDRMTAAAVRLTRRAGYSGAATVEFLVDEAGDYSFMEVNCRIQVEHPVTELVTGMDLVREQIRIAAGERLGLRQSDVELRGAAIEARINAEDPARDFRPTPGRLDRFVPPGGPFTRVDSHAQPGTVIPPDYDPMIGKISVWAPDRDQAIARMDRALSECVVSGRGVHTTTAFLRDVLAHPLFRDARHTTRLVETMLAPEAMAEAG